MILDLPTPDAAAQKQLTAARQAHAAAGQLAAQLEQRAAARLLRATFGAATTLLFEKDFDDDGDTDITMLVLLDASGNLIWFNHEEAYDYPGAEEISDDRGRPNIQIDSRVQTAVENHLRYGYDAAEGVWGAVDVADDEDLIAASPGVNLLGLDIAAALADSTPEEERAYDGSNNVQRGPLNARTRDILVRLIRDATTNVFTPNHSDSMLGALIGDEARVRIDRRELPLLAEAAELLDPRD